MRLKIYMLPMTQIYAPQDGKMELECTRYVRLLPAPSTWKGIDFCCRKSAALKCRFEPPYW